MRLAVPRAFRIPIFTSLSLLACAFAAQTQAQPTFTPLSGNYATMSRNGQHILTVQTNGDIYRWTPATGQAPLGLNVGTNGYVSAITDDGAVIAGFHRNALNQTMAFRWTAATGFTDLGDLPGGTTYSQAFAMSADGNVIVGSSGSAASGTRDEAFRWTPATGIQPLGDLPGGNYTSTAHAISADGSVIVGYSNQTLGYEAFRYTQATGMVGLGDFPGGYFNSQAYAISSDGSVIAGYSSDSLNREQAFRWTQTTGLVALGFASTDPNEWSQAHAISNNGNVIVGNNNTGATIADIDALIWDPNHGMRFLQAALAQDYGIVLPNSNVVQAWDVSDNGYTLAGSGYFNGTPQSWVFVPEPTTLTLILLPTLLLRRNFPGLRRVRLSGPVIL
jgi:probable HAF family extracellular repeat protein